MSQLFPIQASLPLCEYSHQEGAFFLIHLHDFANSINLLAPKFRQFPDLTNFGRIVSCIKFCVISLNVHFLFLSILVWFEFVKYFMFITVEIRLVAMNRMVNVGYAAKNSSKAVMLRLLLVPVRSRFVDRFVISPMRCWLALS